ncbi:low temperature requirement protein A [Allorhizobium borbori]|uniref:Low temperature requirement protein LtrA n=1 Tax=Allorhizobium borbori TaxID=485907 RepID=A0A7W6P353_9HYPH|nr:low temperature requirement protein A [Allorhizobium borbori]MBB4105517.1 low temperature requirement protein LtrA [Allorhizobium borbori]
MSQSLFARLFPADALRKLDAGAQPRVTNMELFFDLVYVFSIIQLSHFLLAHQSWEGVVEAATLFAAVWWAWNYTAWATNWLNPDHRNGRLLMVFLMGCALLMAAAVPEAYSERPGLFVGAYVAMAVVRAAYMALVFRGARMSRNYAQLCVWSVLSGLFWVAGVFLPEHRIWLWIVAVAVDYGAPYAGFWLPGAGSTPMSSWPLKGLHLLERNQQVFIIALGESVLLLGAMLVEKPLDAPMLGAALVGFLVIVAIWWIYFVQLSEAGEHRFSHASDHTNLARAGLAYAHGIMVCGAIVVAVAIEQMASHPAEATHASTALIAFSGPALFLAGSALFHRTMAEKVPFSYPIAVCTIGAWAALSFVMHLPTLALGAGVLVVMLFLALSCREGEAAHK